MEPQEETGGSVRIEVDESVRISLPSPDHDSSPILSSELVSGKILAQPGKLADLKSKTDGEKQLSKGARSFYQEQDNYIDELNDVSLPCSDTQLINISGPTAEPSVASGRITPAAGEKGAAFTTSISLAVNVILLLVKAVVAYFSGSLAIIASALDSLLDLVCGLILFVTSRVSEEKHDSMFPLGKSRAEPVGVIIFSAIMGMVSLQVIIEGAKRLLFAEEAVSFSLLDFLLMCSVVLAKLILFLICRRYTSSAAKALAQDHFNDLITNTLGTIFAYLGATVAVWIDPTGAIIFSLYILYSWFVTAAEEMETLVGKTADRNFLNQITTLSAASNDNLRICTVRAYHFGPNFLVEVHVILDPDMSLGEAHEIWFNPPLFLTSSERVEQRLEAIECVERAFVHLDIDDLHKPQEEHKEL